MIDNNQQGKTRNTVWLVRVGSFITLFALLFGLLGSVALAQGVLRVGSATEPPTLDPQKDAGGPASEIEENIFETLVTFDYDMNLVPLLSTSWKASADGLSYTFTLREGVTFHDGTPLNSEAVQFTFDRALGKIDGHESRYITLMSQLDSVEAVDDLTVVFHLAAPYAPFINNLAHTGFSILSPTAVESLGADFGRAPVGTGPFKFGEWRTGRDITIVKNPDYWNGGSPILDGVTFKYIPDASTRLISLESGEIDMALSVPEGDFIRLKEDPSLRTYQAETLRTVFLMFNPQMKPFDDIAVREAVAEAIDRVGISATLLEGLHRPATRPTFAPDVWGVSSDITPYEYNPEHAVSVLEGAGWTLGSDGVRTKDGVKLQFTLYVTQNRYPKDSEIGAYLRGALARTLGADVELATFEWETYRNNIFAKKLGLFMFGAGVSTGDIDYVATILFHSKSNYSQAATPVEDEIIQAQVTTDQTERLALYEHIQQVIADEYIWIPLYWQNILHASTTDVTGFVPHPLESVRFAGVGFQ